MRTADGQWRAAGCLASGKDIRRYAATEDPRQTYLVGLPYEHHARHSGYSRFGRHVGTPLDPPFKARWLRGFVGRHVDAAVAALTRRSKYTLPVFMMECATAIHMLRHRAGLYHLLNADRDLWLLGRVAGRTAHRLVATFHTPPSELARRGPAPRLIQRLDAVILLSHYQRSFFEGLLPGSRTFVVPHGVDSDFFEPAPDDAGIGEDVCITVGSHLRDFETLAAAIQTVWSVNPSVRLVAVGARNAGVTALHRLADPRIHFLDGVCDEDLRAAYRGARLAVFAFRDATANNSVLEAMACGLPLVCSDVGGTREYVGREAGVLCRRGDARHLAAAVLELLADRGRLARMRALSRARALEHDYRVVAERLRDVYLEVLSA